LTVPLSALTVQGNSIALGSGKGSYSAIDTGTTLIGGPEDAIAAIYAKIPDSSPETGDFEGYYSYRKFNPSLIQIVIHDEKRPSSLQHRCERHRLVWWKELDHQLCGLYDDEGLRQQVHRWLLRAWNHHSGLDYRRHIPRTSLLPVPRRLYTLIFPFQKNVYSVFRYDPPSVGFADLSETALAMNVPGGGVPTATIGSVVAVATGSGTGSNSAPARAVSVISRFGTLTAGLSLLFLAL